MAVNYALGVSLTRIIEQDSRRFEGRSFRSSAQTLEACNLAAVLADVHNQLRIRPQSVWCQDLVQHTSAHACAPRTRFTSSPNASIGNGFWRKMSAPLARAASRWPGLE